MVGSTYYVAADGSTNTAFRVDSLFEEFENARQAGLLPATPEIVLRGRDANGFSGDLVVSYPLSIRGEFGAFLEPGDNSHIIVTAGGSLVVGDVVIGDRKTAIGDTYVRILDGGSMTLADGAVLTNIVCSANYDNLAAGPVAVMGGGTLRLELGSEIVGCRANGPISRAAR